MLVAQQSLFDPTRAPAGKHTLWAYCHVPNGSTVDMTERIEAQIERFAPGFRDVVLARNTLRPADFEARNPNKVGGDIGGGALDRTAVRVAARASRSTRTAWRTASTSARRRRRRAPASTACARRPRSTRARRHELRD